MLRPLFAAAIPLLAFFLGTTSSLPATLQTEDQPTNIANRSPILIFPGLTRSQIEVRHGHDQACITQGYETLWTGERLSKKECIQQELGLTYDTTTRHYSYFKHVDGRAKDFGLTSGIEQNLPWENETNWHNFVEYFVHRGYERGEDIRAAPYDWRLAADELDRLHGYYHAVQALIEKMYQDSDEKKVTLVCLSLGCPTSYYFLTNYRGATSEWKNRYIHTYITINGAWDGGVLALEALISGGITQGSLMAHLPKFDGLPADQSEKIFASILASFQSLYTLIPKASVWGDETLIEFNDRAYNAKQYHEMFEALNKEEHFMKFDAVKDLYNDYNAAPEVPTLCMYSTGVITPKKYRYHVPTNEFDRVFRNNSLVEISCYGDGDGTVNVENARTCHKWEKVQSADFEVKTCTGVPHGHGCGEYMLTWVEDVVNLDKSPAQPPRNPVPSQDTAQSKQSILKELLDALVQEMAYDSIVKETEDRHH